MMTNAIDNGTNLNRIIQALGRNMVRDHAVSAARYAVAPGTQYRLGNGRFASPHNAVVAFSIAANTGIVFA